MPDILYSAVQFFIAATIVIVWVFRHENIVREFKQYGLSDLVRTAVGAAKISLATLLVAGHWYPHLVQVSALLMALLMGTALFYHAKVRNPLPKYLPASSLLLLCVFLACR